MNDAAQPVVVTRAEAPGSGLSGELARLGLPALHWPVVGIEPADPAEWAVHRDVIDTFDWIVFTSAHAAEVLTGAVPKPPRARIAAVGPSTAEMLHAQGWPVDLTGHGNGAEGLLGPLGEAGMRGTRVLYPTSSRALCTLPEGLARLGAEVVRFVAYRTVAAALDVDECRRWIARAGLGAIAFASPSAVTELEHALGRTDFNRLLASAPALAIGPTTARALEARGVTPIIATEHTLRGLALACHAALTRGIEASSCGASESSATPHEAGPDCTRPSRKNADRTGPRHPERDAALRAAKRLKS